MFDIFTTPNKVDREIQELEEKLRLKRLEYRKAEGAYRKFLEAGGKLMRHDLDRLKAQKRARENLPSRESMI